MQPTITRDQAAARVEETIREAASQLPAETKLELGDAGTMPCDDPTDDGPRGRLSVEKTYKLITPPGWSAFRAMETLKSTGPARATA